MTKLGLALAGLASAVVLAGCGGNDDGGSAGGSAGSDPGGGSAGAGSDSGFADRSADSIASSAKADMATLHSVKVSGSLTTGGTKVAIDLQTDSDGDCTGSISTDQGRVRLLGAGGSTWMKPDESFWRSIAGSRADQVIEVVGDKWVVVPSDEASFDRFCDSDDLVQQLVSDDDKGTTYTTTGTDTVDGQDVVKVRSKDSDGQASTGYVLVDDPHYLVKVERTEGDEPGSITFSDFDADVQTEAPAESDTIDLSRLSS